MGSLSSSNVQQKHSVNINIPSSLSTLPLDTSSPDPFPTPTSCAITIDAVDKLELEQYKRKCRQLELALKEKQEELEEGGRDLTETEFAEVKKIIDATEEVGRYQARTINITHSSGATEAVDISELPNSYKQIRNLLWIESQPVYKAALEEWKSRAAILAARVERKIKRSGVLKNEIYNLIGFYSVFQGVLLTSTSQSNYLNCQNVGLVIALSAFASVCSLLGIYRKFSRIHNLETTIGSELTHLKEVKARTLALKRKGEAFRFYDFLEDKETSSQCSSTKFKLCGLQKGCLVPLAIILFSVLFVMAHPLVLCRPGHKIEN